MKFQDMINTVINGDSLEILKTIPNESIQCCITSPPYFGLRDYRVNGQIGLENNPEEYVNKLVEVFREVRRVLKNDGILWLNLGDSYYNFRGYSDYSVKQTIANNNASEMNVACGKRNIKQENLKGKDLIGIPWSVAFALRNDGWYLRQDIIWNKPNPMPESVTDRCTKAHEYIFLLTKKSKYYFDNESIKEKSIVGIQKRKRKNGISIDKGKGLCGEYGFNCGSDDKKNKRSVWTVTTKPFKESHFATFPQELVYPMILAGCPENGIVLDCFAGASTTGVVALKLKRKFIGIELNPDYVKMSEKRLNNYLNELF